MVRKRGKVAPGARREFFYPSRKTCSNRSCGSGLTAQNVVGGRWCSSECAGLVVMIPQQRIEPPPPPADLLWHNTAPNRREHLDLPRECRRRDGTPKLLYRTQGQAIAVAYDLAHKTGRGEPSAYWCTHHAAWHIGN